MSDLYGSQSMVAPLKRVVVRRPNEAFGEADPAEWHYSDQPRLLEAIAEHEAFVNHLQQAGAEIIYHEEMLPHHADAIFTHDPVIVTREGAVVLKMGKPLRLGEEAALAISLQKHGVPIRYQLHGNAQAEGGDLLWIDEQTLAVGQGFRTNEVGLNQLREAVPADVSLIPVQLPYYSGPEACLHLMSFISIVDHDLAVVYPPLMPVPFWQLLERRGFRFVEVPESEFLTMGPNVLAVAPGQCIMLAGNPVTQDRLVAAGCRVVTYKGEEISLKAEGGATCLTRPILRR
ncbi:MAG: arginine deiminase family protein [Ardenticatenaceae bacterium]|nr:arginine deiminase family protein [Ardenticatenaceae bacterium]